MPPSSQPVIILVEPQGDRNIGSVCRVMRNFDFHELRLVKPRADHLSKDARDMAMKEARVILKNATLFPTLATAVADCHLVWGTSRRFGKYRQDWHLPADISPKQQALATNGQHGTPEPRPRKDAEQITATNDQDFYINQKMALVFGREDSGLTTAELALCTSFISIPTSSTFPSMNLAQAVGICLYELRQGSPGNQPKQRQLAANGQIEAMFQHMRQALLAADYLDPQNPDHILHTYRKIFHRAGLDDREVRVLHGLWRRIEWLTSAKKQ